MKVSKSKKIRVTVNSTRKRLTVSSIKKEQQWIHVGPTIYREG